MPGVVGPGRPRPVLDLDDPAGQAVLACAASVRRPATDGAVAAGPRRRAGSPRRRRATGSTDGGGCLPPPADADLRAERLGRDLARYQALQADIAAVEGQISRLLAATDGQILTTLPGVAVDAGRRVRRPQPADRAVPDAEHLYSATGLAPAIYESATLHRRGRISRQGLAEHRDALMGIAWGLSQYSPSFPQRDRELRARGMRPSRPASPWPATPAGSAMPCLQPSSPSTKRVSSRKAQSRAVTAISAMPHDGAT